jgi:hypothetical protein
VAGDAEPHRDSRRQDVEPIRRDREGYGVSCAPLESLASGEARLGPTPDSAASCFRTGQCRIGGVGDDLDRRLVGVNPDGAGESVDDEVVDVPAFAGLADDHSLEAATTAGTLTVRPGAVAGEDARDRRPVTGRGDPEGVPGPCGHRGVGGDDADRRRPVALDELAEEQLGTEEDGDLAGGCRVDDGQVLAPCVGEVDQRERDLVDPAQVDPLRPVAVLEDESAFTGDADERGVVQLEERGIPAAHRTL